SLGLSAREPDHTRAVRVLASTRLRVGSCAGTAHSCGRHAAISERANRCAAGRRRRAPARSHSARSRDSDSAASGFTRGGRADTAYLTAHGRTHLALRHFHSDRLRLLSCDGRSRARTYSTVRALGWLRAVPAAVPFGVSHHRLPRSADGAGGGLTYSTHMRRRTDLTKRWSEPLTDACLHLI